MSGHLFFGERWYGFDDAMYTAARLLEILSRHDDPSAVLDALPTSFSTPELNVPCAEGEHHAVVAELLERVNDGQLNFPDGDVGTIDGLRVDFEDGFGLIRASNTTPVLVLRFEGHTPEALKRIEGQMMAVLQAASSPTPRSPLPPIDAMKAALARAGYSWLLRLLTPAYFARLWWRGSHMNRCTAPRGTSVWACSTARRRRDGCGSMPCRWARRARPRPWSTRLRRQVETACSCC
jgi:hypothetical protein